MKLKIATLPGDGIGPEVTNEAIKVLKAIASEFDHTFIFEEANVGAIAIDKTGNPLHDKTLELCMSSDAILFGSVGGPQYDKVSFDKRPENGLLKLRKEMDLFANLRPAMVFPALANSSTLKKEIVSGLDILIVRELTGGIYFAEPRGIENLSNGEKKGFDTNLYTTREIERIGRVAFDLAKFRNKKVTSVEKSNVMMSGVLWKEVMSSLYENEGKEISLNHMYADNCAMQLVRDPKQFDVIVTDNLFGDILSDTSAMLTGSLGMLPSASLGSKDEITGKRYAMYEPVHGSAPDIAGKGIVNPIAQILSFSMLLRYSFELNKEAELLEKAISLTLDEGYRTKDLASKDEKVVGTSEMTDVIINKMTELTDK